MTDLNDEQKQLLRPITCYDGEPLLPLEEACESLLNIVPHLQDESAAIHLYGMQWDSGNEEVDESSYAHLNRTLE
ncbi:unnamed protein product [Rotaria magnacalcarata]|uniref:Uncharacterized protein n=1 Tax=Rotaria magnacalcarata TaxID=392030 RepID=A0A815ZC81_9BILA|nr:unnamed protein product [Rotaria magnacalcarata]